MTLLYAYVCLLINKNLIITSFFVIKLRFLTACTTVSLIFLLLFLASAFVTGAHLHRGRTSEDKVRPARRQARISRERIPSRRLDLFPGTCTISFCRLVLHDWFQPELTMLSTKNTRLKHKTRFRITLPALLPPFHTSSTFYIYFYNHQFLFISLFFTQNLFTLSIMFSISQLYNPSEDELESAEYFVARKLLRVLVVLEIFNE